MKKVGPLGINTKRVIEIEIEFEARICNETKYNLLKDVVCATRSELCPCDRMHILQHAFFSGLRLGKYWTSTHGSNATAKKYSAIVRFALKCSNSQNFMVHGTLTTGQQKYKF